MSFFIDFIYLPIYNLLAFFVDLFPGGDLGLAVIAVTLAVRFVFLPISLSAARTQAAMKEIQPQLAEIREKHKADPQEQARAMFALYKEHKVKPFSSMLMMLLQIPVLFGLFFVAQDVARYAIDPGLLYPFIPAPEAVNALFLGMFAVATPSLILALVAGATQFLYAYRAVPIPEKKREGATMQDEFGRAMALQVRYMFPFLIAFFAYASGAIALYFAATNAFMIVQDLAVRKTKAKAAAAA